MKFKSLLILSLCAISMRLYGDISCTESSQQCPPGPYGTCEGCVYDPKTKTLSCISCRTSDGNIEYSLTKSGCDSFRNNDGVLDCATKNKK